MNYDEIINKLAELKLKYPNQSIQDLLRVIEIVEITSEMKRSNNR